MPIKWTPETDQMLLLKILETSNISVDVKKISEAWPTNRERPTPRAISERLVKIRNTSKAANGSNAPNFSVSSGRSSQSTPRSTPKKQPKAKPTAGAAKRKRLRTEDRDTPIDSEPEIIKTEDLEGVHNPSKKIKASSPVMGDVPPFLDEESSFTDDFLDGGKYEAEAF